MRQIFIILGVLLMNVSVLAAPVKLMIFGDSLSVGHKIAAKDSFVSKLQQALKAKGHDVVVLNESKSGETTKGALHRVKHALSQKPDAVVIQLGSNDMFQRFPLETTTQNLQKLITDFKSAGLPVFLIGMEVPLDLPQAYRDGTRKMYEQLAIDNNLLLYPFFMQGLWKEDGTHQADDLFLQDGIHPSPKGVDMMVGHIIPAIIQFLNEDVYSFESDLNERGR